MISVCGDLSVSLTIRPTYSTTKGTGTLGSRVVMGIELLVGTSKNPGNTMLHNINLYAVCIVIPGVFG
jgi:hypothetical protein